MALPADFFVRVYEIAMKIPLGKVTTYGAIAKCISGPQASRMVGYALNSSIGMPEIPAHRVVNRKGLLTGKHYFGTSTLMADLLREEGVPVIDDQVQQFEQYFWDPCKEL
jgi:methylated-DNA-protein-cysteine methyltransferase related protein